MSDKRENGDAPLTQQTLTHAIAFRDNSAEQFSEAVNQVELLTRQQLFLYGPAMFPRWRKSEAETTLMTTTYNDFDGRLAPAEAAGMIVLLAECGACAQGIHEVDFSDIREAMGCTDGMWVTDVVDGMATFGDFLNHAAKARDLLTSRDTADDADRALKRDNASLLECYGEAIEADGHVLGRKTASAVIHEVTEYANQMVRGVPESAKTEEDLIARVDSQLHGARLAAELFLEATELASRQLSTTVEEPVQELE